MPLTLREALTTIEPLRQSRVVAGERGLDNIVQFVNVMDETRHSRLGASRRTACDDDVSATR
jgi:hypothetical protein